METHPQEWKQADFPITLGSYGNAWIAAATFERANWSALRSPTAQDGLTPAIRKLAVDRCEKLITLYEERAQVYLKAALAVEPVDQVTA